MSPIARFAPGLARRLLLALLALVLGIGAAWAQPLPRLVARVTDTTGTLSEAQRADLEARLAAIEQRGGSQIAILIVASTAPEAIEQYSIRVVEQWKLGRAKVDDGVLILVAKADRRMRIEVGYGLEGAIPDAVAKRIIAEAMAPRFRAGDFHGGLVAAIDMIAARIAGEALPAPGAGDRADSPGADWLAALLFMAFAGLVLTRIFGVFPGAMLGGAGGGLLAVQAGASMIIGVAGGLVLFFVLLFFGAASQLGRVGPHTYRSKAPDIFPGGGWGGRGGGGGGGFGGGGGGFGGGGASGGW